MTNHRDIAVFVEERLPITQRALRALCTYLEEAGWTKKGEWEFEKRDWDEDEEPLVVRVPATVSTPSSIEASEAFGEILVVLSATQGKSLEEVIAHLQEILSRGQESLPEEERWVRLDTPTFAEVMRKHVTPAQIAAILQEFAVAEDGGRCAVCGLLDVPVNGQGDVIDPESPDFVAYRESHAINCLIRLLSTC